MHRLEAALHQPVAWLVIPVFGFANAGVSLAGLGLGQLVQPATLGVAAGLIIGKPLGVFGAAFLAIRLKLARKPQHAGWGHLFGVALLCGVGFTMSLFIGALAFDDPRLHDAAKLGVLTGSVVSAVLGWAWLRLSPAGQGRGGGAA